MQFKSFFGLAILVGMVVASPAEKRDAKPIVDALTNISKAIKGMTVLVEAFDGDALKGAAILTQSEDLLAIIAKAAAAIEPLPALPLAESVQVLKPGNELITDTQKVVDSLIAKKAAFDKNSLSGVVTNTLVSFKAGSETLLKAISSKLPANVATVGDSIGKQIRAALDKGIAAFPK
jgi:hypothetical protein